MDSGVLGDDGPGVGCCTADADCRGDVPIVKPAMLLCKVCGCGAAGGGWNGLTPRSPGI